MSANQIGLEIESPCPIAPVQGSAPKAHRRAKEAKSNVSQPKRIVKYGVTLVKEGYAVYQNVFGVNFKSPDEVAEFIIGGMKLNLTPTEEFWIICLDTKNQVIGLHMVSRGNLNSSVVHPRETFVRAILNNAASIILCHNHPSGDPTPSQADIDITRRLAEAGELLGIAVLDHIIIGDGNYVSLKEKMLL